MADVEMKEAAGSSKGKPVTKADNVGDKKKFEIKKVRNEQVELYLTILTRTVERRCPMGLGHCRRQLCHLPKPHHGSLYVLKLPHLGQN
jgi:hypothetical protein